MHSMPPTEIGLILISSLICILIFYRFKIPEIVGFLVTGIIIGPHGLGLTNSSETINQIAEIGIVLLLFTLGLEFSLKSLTQIRRIVLVGGALQVGLTILLCTLIFASLGWSVSQAIFFGCIFALSSTAIVLKVLEKKQLLTTPIGVTSVGILLFQDLAIVPMILLIPFLGGNLENLGHDLFVLARNIFIIVTAVYLSRRYFLPMLLKKVSQTRSQEVFIIAVFAICAGFAWGSGALGMSMALGAFIAGLLISESQYGYQAYNTVHSFKELFACFFFVSIGMLLDVVHAVEEWQTILGFIAIISVINVSACTIAVKLLGYPIGISISVALILSQIGEFAFVLAKLGVDYAVIDQGLYQNFLTAGVLTMITGPYVISRSSMFSEKIMRMFRSPSPVKGVDDKVQGEISDHLIIVGYGINGRNLAFAARSAAIPYHIIELNPEVVAYERARGENIIFGDASYTHVLEKVRIASARVACIAISDAFATRKIVDTIHRMHPGLHLIVRSRQVEEVEGLIKLGADEVVPEEFETSLELFARVLRKYLIDRNTISRLTNELKSSQYEKLASLVAEGDEKIHHTARSSVPPFAVEILLVGENFLGSGKTLLALNFRATFGVTIAAIQRSDALIGNPLPTELILVGDQLYVIGDNDNIKKLAELLEPPAVS